VLVVFGILFLATLPIGLVVSRPRTIEDEWERRHGAW
jgi:CP family cyanate transporter-like MFS transporter